MPSNILKKESGNIRAGSKLIIFHVIVIASTIILSLSYAASSQALLQVGTDAIDFTLTDLEGKEVSLSQFPRGKAMILVFWSTWSRKSPPLLKRFEEFHRKYRDKNIQVVGINADNQFISEEDIKSIRNVTQDLDITFPVLIDRGLKTFHSYNVIALPSTLVISDRRISYEMAGMPLVGTEDMFDYLLELAGEKPQRVVKPAYMPLHDAIANTNLARQFVIKKRSMMAFPMFKKAIEKDPRYMLPYVEMARLHKAEGNSSEAEETLRKALSLEPDNVVVMCELGYLLSDNGKSGEAIELLEKAVAKNSYTPSYYYYAYALSRTGKTEEALKAFETAISLNPYEPKIYRLRAGVYEDKGMMKEAAGDYRKTLELMLHFKYPLPGPAGGQLNATK
jgi:Tfp pilus assembly protein PilF/peroxiredoxin